MTVLRAQPRPPARRTQHADAVLAGVVVALAVGIGVVLTLL